MQNEPRYLRKTKKPSLDEWARSVVRDEMGCGFWFRFDRKPLEHFKQGSDMIYFMYYKASSRTSTLGRQSTCTFPLFLSLSPSKNSGHDIYDKYRTTLKSREKKLGCLGTSGPEERHDDDILVFVFLKFLTHISQTWSQRSQQFRDCLLVQFLLSLWDFLHT